MCLSVRLSVLGLLVCLSACLCVRLYVCLSVCLSVRLSVVVGRSRILVRTKQILVILCVICLSLCRRSVLARGLHVRLSDGDCYDDHDDDDADFGDDMLMCRMAMAGDSGNHDYINVFAARENSLRILVI